MSTHRSASKGLPLFLLRVKEDLKKLKHYDELLAEGFLRKFGADYDEWAGFVIAAKSEARALEIAKERAGCEEGRHYEVASMRAVLIAESSRFMREGIVIEDFHAG